MSERKQQPGQRMRRNCRGASLIEFVIVMGLLFTLLFGIIELGVMLSSSLTVSSAAHQGARAAALPNKNVSVAVANGMTGMSGTYTAPVVEYAPNGSSAWTTTVPSPLTSDYQVRVTFTYSYTPLTFMGGFFDDASGKINLTGRAVMRYGG